jgi:hypothetical protein
VCTSKASYIAVVVIFVALNGTAPAQTINLQCTENRNIIERLRHYFLGDIEQGPTTRVSLDTPVKTILTPRGVFEISNVSEDRFDFIDIGSRKWSGSLNRFTGEMEIWEDKIGEDKIGGEDLEDLSLRGTQAALLKSMRPGWGDIARHEVAIYEYTP